MSKVEVQTVDGEAGFASVEAQPDKSIRFVVSLTNDGDHDLLLPREVARELGTQLVNAAGGIR